MTRRDGQSLDTTLSGRIERFVAANALFPRGSRIGVAVSGGIDSMVLLHILHALTGWDLALTVCHVDHGLRPESAADAEFVREAAARLDLPFVFGRVDVPAYARARKLSPEMAARELRYEELRRMARQDSLDHVALGHHRDDQVETVLLRIIRGAGLDGLAGMPAAREDGLFVRPLLAIGRAEIRDYALAQGLAWVEDASNAAIDIRRNRVRHVLLPVLRAEYNPAVDRALLDLARQAREASAYLAADLAAVWPSLAVVHRPGGLSFAGALSDLAPVLGRLALRRLLGLAGGDPGRLSLAATGRMWEFCRGAGGPRLSVPGGFFLVRRPGGFYLGRRLRQEEAALPVPGTIELADGRRLTAAWRSGNPPAWSDVDPNQAYLNGDAVVLPLTVRGRRPGDWFCPLGLHGTKKIKEILIEAKIPREDRDAVPLIVDAEGRILWVGGIRIDERFRVTSETGRLLHLNLV